MMKHAPLPLLVLVIAISTVAGAGDDPEALRPIPLSDVHDRGIAGRLGVRLGTIVRVSGTIVANTTDRKAYAAEPCLLRIDTIDGRALAEPVVYPFAKQGSSIEVTPPVVGAAFHYVGYETGGFVGSPEGEFNHVPAIATTGYHFRTSLVILSEEAVPTRAAPTTQP